MTPTVLTAGLLAMLLMEAEAMEPVALMDTPAPSPETAPVETLPVLVTPPVVIPLFVTLGELLVTDWLMLPTVVPVIPELPFEATEIDPAAPVELTDADAPFPESAPTVRPIDGVVPTAPEVFEIAPVLETV